MRIMGLVCLSIMTAAILAGCASIPLKTVYNLWSFDPWTSDFRQWRAAVRLPQGRGFSLDTARVQMKVENWREGDAVRQSEVFVLERSASAADLTPLAGEARSGFALAAYRFSPNDYARMETLRARILAAKKSGTHKGGSLSISASSCEDGKPIVVDGYIPLSTYLMVDAKDGYNPLLIDYDLGPELRKGAAEGGKAKICAVK